MQTNTPIICNVIYLQIIGWHLNLECYFSSENEKHNSPNLCGGMMAVVMNCETAVEHFEPADVMERTTAEFNDLYGIVR